MRFGIGQRGTCLIWGLLAALLVQLWAPAAARGEGACPGESDHFAGGNGSEACPYLIANPDHLNNVRNELGAHYRLIDDIDLAGTPYVNWGPIGSEGNPFTGKLDGGGHKISNLTIDRPDKNYVGLFGFIGDGAEIRNLGLENVNVTGQDNVGGLVGSNSGTITDSYAKGSVTANSSAGGLVGNNVGTVISSYATGTVMTDDRYAGGLVGTNSGTIERSFAASIVAGNNYVGGLVGASPETYAKPVIKDSYSSRSFNCNGCRIICAVSWTSGSRSRSRFRMSPCLWSRTATT